MKYKRTNGEEWKVQMMKRRRKKHKRSNTYLKSKTKKDKKSLNEENRNAKDQMKKNKI